MSSRRSSLRCHPLGPDRWDDFAALLGPRGACGGCWCMLWRLGHKDFEAGKGATNKRRMQRLVAAGAEPGILAYRDGEAIGWCAVAPRDAYPALARSRLFKDLAGSPPGEAWSVACLYVRKDQRRRGVSVALLRGAVDFVRERGGALLEGYPVEPESSQAIPPAFAWTGIPSAFARAGFREFARPAPTRPVMRKRIRARRPVTS